MVDVKEEYSRTYGIYGEDLNRIINSHVAVIGLGGVGGQIALSLARAGIKEITIIDGDTINKSNINRQSIAFHSNLGEFKTLACTKMMKDINPDIKVNAHNVFVNKDNISSKEFNLLNVDYVADAIDDVEAKLDLIEYCVMNNVPIISSMGAGNKIDPSAFRVSDISKTKVDPLARKVRISLRQRGINHLKVVYSEEEKHNLFNEGDSVPASSPFVPPCVGMIMAGELVNDIILGK